MNVEVWLPVAGYEGLYEISNKGQVKSLQGWNGHKYVKREKILKQTNTTTGYKKVDLTKNGERKSHKVHRLVLKAFVEKGDNGDICNHKDGNPVNNNVENLEWCTQKQNVNHAIEIGLRRIKQIPKDELEELYVVKRIPIKTIGRMYGCSDTCIQHKIKEYGLVRHPSKYGIDIDELKEFFRQGLSNTTIADYYGCPPNLIARRRYQVRKNII